MKKFHYIITSFVITLVLGVSIAHAALDTYTLLEPLPCVQGSGQECVNGMVEKVTVKTYLSYVFLGMLAFATMAAVIRIMAAGIQYMLTDVVFKKGESKKAIVNSVYGLILTLSSYLILRTIDPNLVSFTGELPPISATILKDARGIFGSAKPANELDLELLDKASREKYTQLEDKRLTLASEANNENDSLKRAQYMEQIRNIEIDKIETYTNAQAVVLFEKTRQAISSSDFDIDKLKIAENSVNQIRTNFNLSIIKVNELNDYEKSTLYTRQRNYYVGTLEQEILAWEAMNRAQFNNDARNKLLATYKQNEAANKRLLDKAPELLVEYNRYSDIRIKKLRERFGNNAI